MSSHPLSLEKDYARANLKDLLEARELFHVNFMNKKNVVATAVGLYRIRKNAPWPKKQPAFELERPPRGPWVPKTLDNTEVRYYSWPCILVFVERWVPMAEFNAKSGANRSNDLIPEDISMPDGRRIKTCVILAPKTSSESAPPGNYVFPRNVMGGGFPAVVEVQQKEHIASIGCLVTDGHIQYALTNRHVCGGAGEVVYSVFGGDRVPIGTSAAKQLTRKPFFEVYPDWPGKNVFVNLDAGLIEVDDANLWVSQIYGLGKFGKMLDLSCRNISLQLIGCPVTAYGCASRRMTGEIEALFYRYKSGGGFEYVADFLIGPRDGEAAAFSTHPGDSGTVWFLENRPDGELAPLALQWGGQVYSSGKGRRQAYALATCLSTVCHHLDVDLVNDWGEELPEYWGAIGHYSLAWMAIGATRSPRLRKLLTANRDRVSFDPNIMTPKTVKGLSLKDFVPLADVPDLVWKTGPHRRPEKLENPNHFADLDKKDPRSGRTLLQLCEDPGNIDVDIWKGYYERVEDESRGILPFRVWQIFDRMTEYAGAGRRDEFLCAAGVLAHYVGDACQPMHISYRFDGDPDGDTELRTVWVRSEGKKEERRVPVSKGVHADFDKILVENYAEPIRRGVAAKISKSGGTKRPPVASGREAAAATVELMRRTLQKIDPKKVCDTFARARSLKPKDRSRILWDRFGPGMLDVLADGARTLAHLWDCAWTAGAGDRTISDLQPVPREALRDIYIQPDFLRSCSIKTIRPELEKTAKLPRISRGKGGRGEKN